MTPKSYREFLSAQEDLVEASKDPKIGKLAKKLFDSDLKKSEKMLAKVEAELAKLLEHQAEMMSKLRANGNLTGGKQIHNLETPDAYAIWVSLESLRNPTHLKEAIRDMKGWINAVRNKF